MILILHILYIYSYTLSRDIEAETAYKAEISESYVRDNLILFYTKDDSKSIEFNTTIEENYRRRNGDDYELHPEVRGYLFATNIPSVWEKIKKEQNIEELK